MRGAKTAPLVLVVVVAAWTCELALTSVTKGTRIAHLQPADVALRAARQVAVEFAVNAALDQLGLCASQELLVGAQAALEARYRQQIEDLRSRVA